MSLLPDFKFPRTVGAIGSELPGKSGPGIADFEGIEHPNWPGSNGGRMVWVKDPVGTATILRWEVRDNDVCLNQYGPDGQRLEMWTPSGYRAENIEGSEGWFAWSWFLGDGQGKGDLFRYPTSPWSLMFQHHDGAGSPPQALQIRNGLWCWSTRSSGFGEADYRDFAPCTRGRWHFFLNYMRFTTGNSGVTKLWHSLDKPPSETDAPVDARANLRTLYGNGNGITTLHMYRADGVAADYPWIAYSGGFGRAGSAAQAKKLADWDAMVPPVDPPDPPDPQPDPCEAQLAETEAALDDATDRLEQARALNRQQITLWRSQGRSWSWIRTQPAAKAFYGPLGGV